MAYISRLAELDDPERLGRAMDALTLTEKFLPSLAQVVEAYEAEGGPLQTPALPEPECLHGSAPGAVCSKCEAEAEAGRAKVRAVLEKWAAEKDSDREVFERFQREVGAMPRSRTVCSGAGKRPVQQGDRLVCPGCGEPVWETVRA